MNNKEYEDLITDIPDFPKKGVVFKDISPLLKHKITEVADDMGQDINWDEIDAIVGIESRGFILGAAMAVKHGKGFILMRKKGKLPPPIMSESYSLEYGTDILEMRHNDEKLNILLVDDVLATGGTLIAAKNLCEKNNYTVKGMSVLINLKFLNDFHLSGLHVHSVLNYE